MLALETVVVLFLGDLAFGVPLPSHWYEVIALVALGAACFAGLGIAVTRFVPNAEGSSAIVNAIYLPVLFLSGAFFPVHGLPDFLQWFADALPLTHLLDAMRSVFIHGGRRPRRAAGPAGRGAVGCGRRDRRPAHVPVGAVGRLTVSSRVCASLTADGR